MNTTEKATKESRNTIVNIGLKFLHMYIDLPAFVYWQSLLVCLRGQIIQIQILALLGQAPPPSYRYEASSVVSCAGARSRHNQILHCSN